MEVSLYTENRTNKLADSKSVTIDNLMRERPNKNPVKPTKLPSLSKQVSLVEKDESVTKETKNRTGKYLYLIK